MLIFALNFVGKRIKTNPQTLDFTRLFRFVLIILYSHSAVSLLIEMGFTALAIAERMGHEAIDITYRYAHLFPTTQTQMADKLNVGRLKQEEQNGEM